MGRGGAAVIFVQFSHGRVFKMVHAGIRGVNYSFPDVFIFRKMYTRRMVQLSLTLQVILIDFNSALHPRRLPLLCLKIMEKEWW